MSVLFAPLLYPANAPLIAVNSLFVTLHRQIQSFETFVDSFDFVI